MDSDQQKAKATRLKMGAVLAFVANLVGCAGLTLVAPALMSPTRIALFAVMVTISLLGVVVSVLAALRAGSRTVGIVVLVLCLGFGGLWSLALVGEVTSPVTNDTPE